MAGKTSGLLEERSRYDGGSARNSRRQGSQYGQAGARSGSNSSSKTSGSYKDQEDTTNKTNAGRCEPGSCKSPANATTEPACKSNNGGIVGNNSNNSGLNSACNRSSYSKIFRQYLPNSLNLNFTPTNSGIKSKRTESKVVARAKANSQEEEEEEAKDEEEDRDTEEELNKQQRVIVAQKRVQQVESGQSKIVARSIASALSRFKISLNSVKDKQASDSLLDHFDQSKCSLKSTSPSSIRTQTFKAKHRISTVSDINNNNNNNHSERQVKVQFNIDESREHANELWKRERPESRQVTEKQQRVQRKGFLYLKKINKKGEHIEPISSECRQSRIVTEEIGRGRATIHSHKKFSHKDQNNNISSLLSSSSNVCHDEHTTCLLDELEDEEEEDMINVMEKSKQPTIFNQRLKSNTKETEKMSPPNRNNKSNLFKTSKGSRLLATGSLMAALLIGLAALLTSVTLAQQQVPSGASFRSQPSLQAGGQQSLQQMGGLKPVSNTQASLGNVNRSPSSQSAAQPPQPVAGSLVANINCNKIRGHVTLTPNLRGGTTVTTQISAGPPGEVYQWSVHQFPVKPGAAMCSCSALILGTKLIDLSEMHGNLPSDQEFNVQSSLNLFGAESPVGHSLMLRGMKTGMVACATFLPTR